MIIIPIFPVGGLADRQTWRS